MWMQITGIHAIVFVFVGLHEVADSCWYMVGVLSLDAKASERNERRLCLDVWTVLFFALLHFFYSSA